MDTLVLDILAPDAFGTTPAPESQYVPTRHDTGRDEEYKP